MVTAIDIYNANLRFRIYRNPSPALKEAVLGMLTRKKDPNAVIEFDALKNIDLHLRGGDRVGVIGLNGAGKSTLLKMIVGIYPPHRGRVEVKGKISPLIELGTGFDFELSGRENIYLNGALLGRSYKQMKQLEEQIVDFSELGDKIDLPLKYYSSGMHGRLAFAIGTLVEPEILLVDEIFSTGDVHFVEKASERMHALFNFSQIVILVSHNLDQIAALCNKVIVLHEGAIVAQGDPLEMIEHYLREVAKVEKKPSAPILATNSAISAISAINVGAGAGV
jgi:ABC-type polysaccharide/polyol phosphate transport system ATPase subunit